MEKRYFASNKPKNVRKMNILISMYRVSTISIKNFMGHLTDHDKFIIKFMCNNKTKMLKYTILNNDGR